MEKEQYNQKCDTENQNKEFEEFVNKYLKGSEIEKIFRDRHKEFDDLEDEKRKQFLSSIDVSKFSDIQKWYESLTVEEYDPNTEAEYEREDEKYNRIEKGRKAIDRLRNYLKSIGIDIGRIDSSDKLELLDFLYWFKYNNNIEYKLLLKKPSLENLEYLSEDENTVNGKLLGTMGCFIRKRCPKTAMDIDILLIYIEWMEYKLTEIIYEGFIHSSEEEWILLQMYLKYILYDIDNISKISVENPHYDFFEKIYFKLDMHNLESEATDFLDIYDIIQDFVRKVKTTIKISENDCQLLYKPLKVDEIENYVAENKQYLINLLNITEKKYDILIKSLLPKYIEMFDDGVNEVLGIKILAMLEEAGIRIPDEKGKEISKENKFYRYTTADAQKTLGAALKGGKQTRLKVSGILVERVNALPYVYTGRRKEYILLLEVLKIIQEIKLEVSRFENHYRIEDFVEYIGWILEQQNINSDICN